MTNSVIINFIITYWIDIVIIIGLIGIILGINWYIIHRDKTGKVRRILKSLIIEAEKYLGSKTGKEKKELVITWLFQRYKFLSLFLDMEYVSNLIDKLVAELNEYLDSVGADLRGLDEEIPNE